MPAASDAKKRREPKNAERIQKILMNSDKMASLGQLIAGVAHELNNPISFIESNVIFLEKYCNDLRTVITMLESSQTMDADVRAKVEAYKKEMEWDFAMGDMENILKSFNEGATRIRSILASLSAFSRGNRIAREEMNIHEAIDNTINLLRYKSRHVVEFETKYKANPYIIANRGEINQVLMNLIINAIHAVQHKFENGGKGAIYIHTHSGENFVYIDIKDNGEGIPDIYKNEIFKAFFTTKKEGEGTGLGLPISKEIVEKHGGAIEFESRAGIGTCFTVKLPFGTDEEIDVPKDTHNQGKKS
ncbi:HAMP domain-containing histidine kinase [bacterium]|nr:HAMP domain-containing histidine kinase [bacterium]NUN45291.1 HAMP domain-containing histidine kinase [bacterium]